MKTYLTYGSAMAGGGFLLTIVLYVLGFHSDAEKIGTSQMIQMCVGLVIGVVCIVLGTKAKRATVPLEEDFGYGSALGAGVMISLFAGLIGIVTTLIYVVLINPGMNEIVMQAQVAKWEAAGMTSAQIEQAQGFMKSMMSPPIQAAFGFLGGLFFGTLISLVTSAFLKRSVTDSLPPVG